MKDIFLAYNLVGPNIRRVVQFVQKYPQREVLRDGDHPSPVAQLGEAMLGEADTRSRCCSTSTRACIARVAWPPLPARALRANRRDARPHRRRLSPLRRAESPEGSGRTADRRRWRCGSRRLRFATSWSPLDLPVPRIVCGGTASFPIFAEMDDPAIELSPGTTIFHDCGYGDAFPDLHFTPAALLLTRVISRPTDNRVTLDLGYKAVASEPAGRQPHALPRPARRQARPAERRAPRHRNQRGRALLSRATSCSPFREHICPTSALHQQAYVICRRPTRRHVGRGVARSDAYGVGDHHGTVVCHSWAFLRSKAH